MVTRRTVLASLGLSAVASAQRRGGGSAIPADSPILQLKSRRAEASPITVEERKARIERARVLMRENKIDAMVLTGGTSLEYFGAIHWGLSERLFTMVLPSKGEPFFVSPAFEEDRARGISFDTPYLCKWTMFLGRLGQSPLVFKTYRVYIIYFFEMFKSNS